MNFFRIVDNATADLVLHLIQIIFMRVTQCHCSICTLLSWQYLTRELWRYCFLLCRCQYVWIRRLWSFALVKFSTTTAQHSTCWSVQRTYWIFWKPCILHSIQLGVILPRISAAIPVWYCLGITVRCLQARVAFLDEAAQAEVSSLRSLRYSHSPVEDSDQSQMALMWLVSLLYMCGTYLL